MAGAVLRGWKATGCVTRLPHIDLWGELGGDRDGDRGGDSGGVFALGCTIGGLGKLCYGAGFCDFGGGNWAWDSFLVVWGYDLKLLKWCGAVVASAECL